MEKLEAIKCPNCGSPLAFTEDQEYCFCSHCGSQIYKEDIHYDKNMEYKMKKLDAEAEQDKRDGKLLIVAFGVLIIVVVLMVVVAGI